MTDARDAIDGARPPGRTGSPTEREKLPPPEGKSFCAVLLQSCRTIPFFCSNGGRRGELTVSETLNKAFGDLMRATPRAVGSLVVIIALVAAAATYFAPEITIYQLRQAVKDKDDDALSEHIDFPAVRESLKSQLQLVVANAMAEKKREDNPLAALGVLLAEKMIDGMVDGIVSPPAIRMSFQLQTGSKAKSDGERDAGGGAQSPDRSSSQDDIGPSFTVQSRGLSRFVLVQHRGNFSIHYTFKREGLTWKLVNMDLPPDILKNQQ
jgi:hypothetical protein